MEERFEGKYEEQKIPEWYDLYCDYKHLKTIIAVAKLKIKCKTSLSYLTLLCG